MYLDFAEDQAKRHKQVFMKNWREKLDAFLALNERDILKDSGKVRKVIADKLALEQHEIYNTHRLVMEAKQEALTDDALLKELENNLEGKIKSLKKGDNK